MNKIKVVNGKIESSKIDSSILCNYQFVDSLFGINTINLDIKKDTKIDLNINFKIESKLKITINVNNNCNTAINIYINGLKDVNSKLQFKYNIDENSECFVEVFEDIKTIKESNVINLNGKNAKFYYNMKTLATLKQTHDMIVYHNESNTESIMKNKGINILDGILLFQVSSVIPKNINGCVTNQVNQIINLTDNKCEIKPILYIDSSDVVANHSALVGTFYDDELFYLMSRGINLELAYKLLIRGFLTNEYTNKFLLNKVNKVIDKYWR